MMNRNQQRNLRMGQRICLVTLAITVCYLASCTAFSPPLQHISNHKESTKETPLRKRFGSHTPSYRISSPLYAENQQPTADFEYQELQIQMNAMREQDVKPSQLQPAKREELKGYVEQILSRRLVNQKTVDSTVPLDARLRSSLPGTKWRMAFTTQSLMAEALPKDATITLNFASGSGSAATGSNKVDYGLDFFKTLGLKRLVAKSTYTVMEVRGSWRRWMFVACHICLIAMLNSRYFLFFLSMPFQPQQNFPGVAFVQIMYENIVTDVMGFTNVGIGMFGMLKGRSTYINTVFFDNNIWIESGVDEANFGETYYNVYTRDEDREEGEDDEDWQR